VWYCLAMSTVFQAFFTSYLVDPGYQKQLTTLEEILESGIEFGYLPAFDRFYSDSSDWRHMELLSRREKCSNVETCIYRIRETGNFATFCGTWVLQHHTNFINDRTFVCPLNDEDSFPVFLMLYVKKGSFFLEVINQLVSIATESGIFLKAVGDRMNVNKDVADSTKIFGDYFVFTLSHLHIAFCVLFVGHGLSVLSFLGELLFHITLKKCNSGVAL
jgi:hypothetical protein